MKGGERLGGRKGGKEGEGREGGKRIYDYGVRREKGGGREECERGKTAVRGGGLHKITRYCVHLATDSCSDVGLCLLLTMHFVYL